MGAVFKSEEYSDLELAINDLLSFYNIYYSDIEQLSRKYSISEFPDKYKYFRTRVENIDQFLMANATFKQYIESMIEKQKQNEKKLQENWENKNPELVIKRKKEKRIIQNNLNALEKMYQDSIADFITKSDFYNIFSLAYLKSNNSFFELNNKLKIDLKDKYIEYIKILKDIFKDDKTYISLKNDLISNKLSYNETLMFVYLFNILDVQEKELLLNTNENYTKLFWHLYRYNDYMNSDFFQKISNKYHIELEKLSIEVIQLSLEQSQNKKMGFSYILKELLIHINIYNKISMPNLIIYIESISQEVYSTLEETEKEIFLEILALNEENFDFIKNMMLKDKDNCHWYLNHLLSINKNLAIEHFNNLIYNKISNKRSKLLVVSLFLGLSTESKCHEYHNPKINPEKIQSFLCFMKAMKKHTFEDIDSSILKMILVDYYQFFNEYTIPSGSYTPDIYDYMNSKMNNLWRYLENTTEHIELLKELTTINSNKISKLANYSLDIVYKLQAKERDITNDYYKKIFDTKTTVEHRTIYNNGNYAEENNGNMSIK